MTTLQTVSDDALVKGVRAAMSLSFRLMAQVEQAAGRAQDARGVARDRRPRRRRGVDES